VSACVSWGWWGGGGGGGGVGVTPSVFEVTLAKETETVS